MIPSVVQSAEEWGEVPGAVVRVQREGGFLPDGYHVISRVIVDEWWMDPDRGPAGLRIGSDTYPVDILLISK